MPEQANVQAPDPKDPLANPSGSGTDTRVDLTERGESVRHSDLRGAWDPNTATDSLLSTTLFALFVASIVVFGTTANFCGVSHGPNYLCHRDDYRWAIAAGVISTVALIIILFLRICAKLYFAPITDLILALFFVIWWAFGVGFTTGPGGPFYELNSGWWNVWLALVLSVVYFVYAYKRVAPGNMFVNTFSHTLFIIFFASLVEMGVSANLCSLNDKDGHYVCDQRLGWAVAQGTASAGLVIIQLLISHLAYKIAQATGRIIATLLLLIWIFGVSFNVSVPHGLYVSACEPKGADGFYATWIAFYASVVYFWRVVVYNVPEERA